MGKSRRDDETQPYRDAGERTTPARKRRGPKRPSRNTTVWWAVAAAVLAAGVAGSALWLRAKRATPPAPEPVAGGPPPAVSDLDAAVAEADRLDPGWRMDQLLAKRAVVPDSENSAPVVREASNLMPRASPQPPDFVGRVGGARPTDQQLAELDSWLAPRAGGIKLALALADKPRGRHELRVAPDFISTMLPHADDVRRVATALQAEGVRRAEAGSGGLEVFRASLNAARSLGDEPMMVTQVTRLAVAHVAILGLEQTLARTTPDEDALAAAQALLTDEAGHNGLLVGARGERATLFALFEAVDTGKVSTKQIQDTLNMFSPKRKWPADIGPGSPELRAARAWSLRHWTERVELAKKPPTEQFAGLAKLKTNEKPAPQVVLLFLVEGALDLDLLRMFQRREALLRSAIVAVAAERFRLRNGRWPLEAKELAGSVAGPLPADPYDGSPLRFRRLDDGLVVYSIGPNGRDDGGDLGDRGKDVPDVGFRLWDAGKRR